MLIYTVSYCKFPCIVGKKLDPLSKITCSGHTLRDTKCEKLLANACDEGSRAISRITERLAAQV